MFSSFSLCILLLLFSLFSGNAHAWPPTYGSEFNFGCQSEKFSFSNGSKGKIDQQKCLERFLERLKINCPECEIKEHVGKWDSEYWVKIPSENWGFNLAIDPAVVEVQTNPQTLAEIKRTKQLTQKYIFDVARESEMLPSGSSHFNIGVRSAFEESPEALLRFYVDYANRPALGTGIFGRDVFNAPPVATLKSSQRERLTKLVSDSQNRANFKLEELGKRINREVHSSSPAFWTRHSARHYQAIGMKQLEKDDFKIFDFPMEIRSVKHHWDAHEYELFADLIERKIAHLKKQTDPIVYLNRELGYWEWPSIRSGAFWKDLNRALKGIPENALDPARAAAMDHSFSTLAYFEEMGLDWQNYSSLIQIPTTYLSGGYMQSVLSGKIDWFDEEDRFLFEKVITRDAPLTAWNREQFLNMLVKGNAPQKVVLKALETLEQQMITSPTARASIQKIYESMKAHPYFGAAKVQEWFQARKAPRAESNCLVKMVRSLFRK